MADPDRQALERLRSHLRRAHRVAAVGTWEADLEGEVRLRWSGEAVAIAGLPPGSNPTYQEFVSMVHPDDRPFFLEMRSAALSGGRPYAIDVRIEPPGGGQRRVHFSADIERDQDGRPIRLLGAALDRTEELDGLRRLRVTEVARRDLLQRVLDTADNERARLARHLASGPIDRLVEIERRFAAEMPEEPPQVWVDGLASIGKAVESLRQSLTDIQSEPTTVGLAQGIDELAAESVPDVAVRVEVSVDVPLRPALQVTLLRVVQEALHNVRKHAEATRAEVHCDVRDGWVHVSVTDDGRGYDVDAVQRLSGHLGIVAMRDRLESLGGRVEIRSRPGRTTVEARLPVV